MACPLAVHTWGPGSSWAPSLAYMDRAYVHCRTDGMSPAPIVEMLIPSTIDDSLAPPGAHVASLFCQHFRYQLPDGRRWQDERDRAADLIIDTVTQYARTSGAASSVDSRYRLWIWRNASVFWVAISFMVHWGWIRSGPRAPYWATAITARPCAGYICADLERIQVVCHRGAGTQRRARDHQGPSRAYNKLMDCSVFRIHCRCRCAPTGTPPTI